MPHDKQVESSGESAPMERSRATPLRPAIWMTGVLVWATVIAFLFQVPTWGGVFLCSLTGLSFLLYLIAYIYLMVYDREALRRERHWVKRVSAQGGKLLGADSYKRGADLDQPVVMETQPLDAKQAARVGRETDAAQKARVVDSSDA